MEHSAFSLLLRFLVLVLLVLRSPHDSLSLPSGESDKEESHVLQQQAELKLDAPESVLKKESDILNDQIAHLQEEIAETDRLLQLQKQKLQLLRNKRKLLFGTDAIFDHTELEQDQFTTTLAGDRPHRDATHPKVITISKQAQPYSTTRNTGSPTASQPKEKIEETTTLAKKFESGQVALQAEDIPVVLKNLISTTASISAVGGFYHKPTDTEYLAVATLHQPPSIELYTTQKPPTPTEGSNEDLVSSGPLLKSSVVLPTQQPVLKILGNLRKRDNTEVLLVVMTADFLGVYLLDAMLRFTLEYSIVRDAENNVTITAVETYPSLHKPMIITGDNQGILNFWSPDGILVDKVETHYQTIHFISRRGKIITFGGENGVSFLEIAEESKPLLDVRCTKQGTTFLTGFMDAERTSNALVTLTDSNEILIFYLYSKTKQCKLGRAIYNDNEPSNSTNGDNATFSSLENDRLQIFPGSNYFYTLSRKYLTTYALSDKRVTMSFRKPLKELLNISQEFDPVRDLETAPSFFVKRETVSISYGNHVYVFSMPLSNLLQSWIFVFLTNPLIGLGVMIVLGYQVFRFKSARRKKVPLDNRFKYKMPNKHH